MWLTKNIRKPLKETLAEISKTAKKEKEKLTRKPWKRKAKEKGTNEDNVMFLGMKRTTGGEGEVQEMEIEM